MSSEENRTEIQTDEIPEDTFVHHTTDDNPDEEVRHSSHRHHHSGHHSSRHSHSGSKYSHSRHSKKRRRSSSSNNKLVRFLKKHLVNIIVIILAISAVIAVAVIADNREAPVSTPQETDQGNAPGAAEDNDVTVTENSLRIEVPFFDSELSLVRDDVLSFVTRDLSVAASDAIDQYKQEGERLDVSVPVSLAFDVTGLPAEYSVVSSTVELSESSEFESPIVYTLKGDERSIDAANLKTGTEYHYRITLNLANRYSTTTNTVQGSFKTADTPRILTVDGIVNVRDIGGWKTADGKTIRQGILYRGSEMDGAVESDYSITPDGLNEMVSTFKIRTDMDLRSSTVNSFGTDALGANVEHIYYGVTAYEDALINGGASYRNVFSDLADPAKYPVYLHCTHGSDRTGTVCYILEALLGMSEEDLLREYELSVLGHGWLDDGAMDKFVTAFKALEGDTMQEKAEGYLLSIGVTANEIASIKNIFLEG